MIDRYTTGVDIVLVEHTLQISLLKICSVYFSVEDIKNNISRHISKKPRSQSREEGRDRPEIMRKSKELEVFWMIFVRGYEDVNSVPAMQVLLREVFCWQADRSGLFVCSTSSRRLLTDSTRLSRGIIETQNTPLCSQIWSWITAPAHTPCSSSYSSVLNIPRSYALWLNRTTHGELRLAFWTVS